MEEDNGKKSKKKKNAEQVPCSSPHADEAGGSKIYLR